MRRLQFLLIFIAGCCFARQVWAEPTTNPTTQPSESNPVVSWSEHRMDPPMALYFVKVDLTNPKVHVRISGAGADPDGRGPWLTTLMVPTEIAAREHFDVCVNASFFSADKTKDAEGLKSGYVEGKWASPNGVAMTDGKLWSPIVTGGGGVIFWIDDAGRGHLTLARRGLQKSAQQAVQGNPMVLVDGTVPDFGKRFPNTPNPRTVVGLDADGKTLTLLIIDGRNPFHSMGMTITEEGQEMLKVGCVNAVNMDGGGSSELVMRDANGKLQVMNHPSDFRERAVADVIGVSVDGTKRAEDNH